MNTNFQTILNKLYIRSRSSLDDFLSEETYILAIESVFSSVIITDKEGIVQYINPAVERITGYTRNEIIGKKVGLWGGIMDASYYRNLWKTINEGNIFQGEIQNKRKNGDLYTAKIVISPIQKKGKIIGFIGTEEDITLEKKIQKEKEEFISLASHQLRTPLGAMKWGLELLADSNPRLRSDISNIAIQNQLMIDLVNRLLIVLRIADNRIPVKKDIVNISTIIEPIISSIQLKLHKKDIFFSFYNPHPNLSVFTDVILLQEILLNTLDNAIKYSKNKGKISFQLTKEKDHWSFSVKDAGIGIPLKEIPHVYNKFYRGSNTISIPGTGLGMYIVKTYIHLLKGSIAIKSSLNKGTKIICTFPLK